MTLELQGIGVSRGITIGRAHLLLDNQLDIEEYILADDEIDQEVERFLSAVEQAKQQLKAIRKHIPTNAPADVSAFIDTHILMLNDSSFNKIPADMIRKRGCNAEWALQLQRDAMLHVFDEMNDPYLKTRRDDVEHVVSRIHQILAHQQISDKNLPAERLKDHIVIAKDLTPADIILMQHQGIAAFITEHGGATSHTTILSRSLGIPAVIGVESIRRYVQDNELIIVDGEAGVVLLGADEATHQQYQQKRITFNRHRAALSRYKSQPAITKDGIAISVQANADLPEDTASILNAGVDGIGLYRTEFLYMNRATAPEEEEQLAAYRQVIEIMNNQPVTIRTFDLGADKNMDNATGSQHSSVTNPALGLRAIRVSLNQPQLFRTQLRAILRASAYGKVKIMFPMITNVAELHQARQMLEQCKQELDNENIAYDRHIEIGAMVEVPASAICADLLAQHVDFLSIGTNDLIQYTLAIDRIDEQVNYLYDPLNPAVLQLIQMTLNAGKKHKVSVSMCGEMASDLRYTRLLLTMGLTQFSMHPNAVLDIKQAISETNLSELTINSTDLINAADQVEMDILLTQLNQ